MLTECFDEFNIFFTRRRVGQVKQEGEDGVERVMRSTVVGLFSFDMSSEVLIFQDKPRGNIKNRRWFVVSRAHPNQDFVMQIKVLQLTTNCFGWKQRIVLLGKDDLSCLASKTSFV